jgi:hypothetical protein
MVLAINWIWRLDKDRHNLALKIFHKVQLTGEAEVPTDQG